MSPISDKPSRLFILLGGFFISNALIAEFIGAKIFSLEKTFGLSPANIPFAGLGEFSFNLTAGVLLWPVVFVMTDIINEYYGRKGVRMLSFMAAGLIAYAFLMVFLSIGLAPADFWVWRVVEGQSFNMHTAFNNIFGQGLWIIIGSITAFLTGQLADVTVFHWLKKRTGEKGLWARATGSTLISQIIDSYIVLLIAFCIGPPHWPVKLVLAVGTVNYLYKFTVAILLTPVIYAVHAAIDRYLGKELSLKLRQEAMGEIGVRC